MRVFDFGIEHGAPFLVMDYAPNSTLRQRHVRGVPLPLSTIVPYVKQVADALQYAHDEKLIHRDIKPENMLLGRRNEVLLSDFGIAVVAHSSRSQKLEAAMGTVDYMAPEQILEKPVPASDQYALGVVVYEWLCGVRPFQGSPREVFGKQLYVPPPTLREKVPTISSVVEQVVLTALAKEPQQRFARVQAFATALEQAALSAQPATFAPSSQPPPVVPTTPDESPSLPGTALPPSQWPQPTVAAPQPNQQAQATTDATPPASQWAQPTEAPPPRSVEPQAPVMTPLVAQKSKPRVPTGEQPPTSHASGTTTASSTTSSSKAPPSLPPTQPAKNAPLPAARASIPSSPPISQDKPVTQPASERQATPKRPDGKVRVWSIGRWQIVAMVVGIILYGTSLYALHSLIFNNSLISLLRSPFLSFQGSGGFISIDILFGLTFITPLFLSARFGPWTGLATIVGGFLLEEIFLYNYDIIYTPSNLGFGPSWYLVLAGYAAFGFIPGLALLLSRGRRSRGTIGIAVAMSAIGIVIGSAFLAWNELSFGPFFVQWLIHFFGCIINLILLPILLLVYNAFANRRMKA